MIFPENSVVVLDVAGNKAVVACTDPTQESWLRSLGFLMDGETFSRPITSDNDRKKLLEMLAYNNSLFSAGKDWAPAELLAYYKEQGLLLDKYKIIAWHSPEKYEVITVSG